MGLPEHVVTAHLLWRLNVHDRTRLAIACGKRRVNASKDADARDAKLGILLRAIRKGRVQKLSSCVCRFLQSLSSSDATVQDIAESFPEVRSMTFGRCCLSLFDKAMARLPFDTADIAELMSDAELWRANVVSLFSAEAFCRMYKSLEGRRCIDSFVTDRNALSHFAFCIMNYRNADLLKHLVTDGQAASYGMEGLHGLIIDKLATDHVLSPTIKFAWQHIEAIPLETTIRAYERAVGELDADLAMFLEAYMQ